MSEAYQPFGMTDVNAMVAELEQLKREDLCLYQEGVYPPNYPVPAIRYIVVRYASGDCIEIRSYKPGLSKRLIDKVFWKPV